MTTPVGLMSIQTMATATWKIPLLSLFDLNKNQPEQNEQQGTTCLPNELHPTSWQPFPIEIPFRSRWQMRCKWSLHVGIPPNSTCRRGTHCLGLWMGILRAMLLEGSMSYNYPLNHGAHITTKTLPRITSTSSFWQLLSCRRSSTVCQRLSFGKPSHWCIRSEMLFVGCDEDCSLQPPKNME